MKIGIFVRKQNVFSNGAGQNCIFMCDSLRALGHVVDLIYIDECNLNSYQLIIFGTIVPHEAIRSKLRCLNIPCIMFSPCNVVDQFHNENFLYDCRPSSGPLLFEMTFKDIADEIWVTENHYSSIEYLEVINQYQIPVVSVPLVWSPMFLPPVVNRLQGSGPIDILIMEPNLGYCKSGWIPLIICEKLFLDFPQTINKVYLFNTPEKNKTAMNMISSLEVWKKEKLRIMKRIPIPDILGFFNKTPCKPVVLSNSINSPLNYAYFDILHGMYNFVHNSNILQSNNIGHHYNTISEGVIALQKISNDTNLNCSDNISDFLANQHPCSKKSLETFENILKKYQ